MSPGSISVGVTSKENTCGLADISVGAGVSGEGVSTDAGLGVFLGGIGTTGVSVGVDTNTGRHDGVNWGVDAIGGSAVSVVVGGAAGWLQAASSKANAIIVTNNCLPITVFCLPFGLRRPTADSRTIADCSGRFISYLDLNASVEAPLYGRPGSPSRYVLKLLMSQGPFGDSRSITTKGPGVSIHV